MNANILGIDPALSTTGWAIIRAEKSVLEYVCSGVIKTKASLPIQYRLAEIVMQLDSVILAYSPKIVAMEETFINSNAVSSLKLGYARGAMMALIGKYSLDFREFKPNHVKKTVTGLGHADKMQMLKMIKILLPSAVELEQFDEADALGIAYTCYLSMVSPSFR